MGTLAEVGRTVLLLGEVVIGHVEVFRNSDSAHVHYELGDGFTYDTIQTRDLQECIRTIKKFLHTKYPLVITARHQPGTERDWNRDWTIIPPNPMWRRP